MRNIEKKIVVDEAHNPVAVQIDYENWLKIERLLEGQRGEQIEDERDDFEALADKIGEAWQGGDGLEYQIKIREE